MPDESELDRFARALMERVRDPAIEGFDRLLHGTTVGPSAERWRALTADDAARNAVHELIPDIVDGVLFELLNAADHHEIALAWQTENDRCTALDELGRGEMAGWLMGVDMDAWRSRFSSQRFWNPYEGVEFDFDDL